MQERKDSTTKEDGYSGKLMDLETNIISPLNITCQILKLRLIYDLYLSS